MNALWNISFVQEIFLEEFNYLKLPSKAFVEPLSESQMCFTDQSMKRLAGLGCGERISNLQPANHNQAKSEVVNTTPL